MKTTHNYFLFISKDDYKSVLDISKRVKELYATGIILCISLAILWATGIRYILYGVLPVKFGAVVGIVVITPLIIELLRGFMAEYKKYQNLTDLWISDKGINLPLPYSVKENKHFISFDYIEKIEIWPNMRQSKRLATIIIYLKKPYRTDFIFQIPTQIRLYLKKYQDFYTAIYKATNGKLLISIKC